MLAPVGAVNQAADSSHDLPRPSVDMSRAMQLLQHTAAKSAGDLAVSTAIMTPQSVQKHQQTSWYLGNDDTSFDSVPLPFSMRWCP
jgi:hypothetical protein